MKRLIVIMLAVFPLSVGVAIAQQAPSGPSPAGPADVFCRPGDASCNDVTPPVAGAARARQDGQPFCWRRTDPAKAEVPSTQTGADVICYQVQADSLTTTVTTGYNPGHPDTAGGPPAARPVRGRAAFTG